MRGVRRALAGGDFWEASGFALLGAYGTVTATVTVTVVMLSLAERVFYRSMSCTTWSRCKHTYRHRYRHLGVRRLELG